VVPVALIGAGTGGIALLAQGTGEYLHQSYVVDDYRSAVAKLSSDLLQHPGPVVMIPDWAGAGFLYATPPELARRPPFPAK
jgi:hypothetical protein